MEEYISIQLTTSSEKTFCLSHCDVNIEYLKGKENVRQMHFQSFTLANHQDGHRKVIIPVHMLTTEIPADSTSVAEFRKATAEDTKPGILMQTVKNCWPESGKDCHPLLLDYWTYREGISAENGLLFEEHRLIIPEKLHNRTLQTIHEGPFSVEKIQLMAKEPVFWPKITVHILQTAQSCKVCQTFSKSWQREILM